MQDATGRATYTYDTAGLLATCANPANKTGPCGSRHMADEASFGFRCDGRDIKYCDVALKWGKIITVDLDCGELP